MSRSTRALVFLLLGLATLAGSFAAERTAVVGRARAELAALLKKDPAKVPTDRPVLQLGADDLTVVEWVMALERAYKIRIPDEATTDSITKTTRTDLTVESFAAAVVKAMDRAEAKR